MKKKILLIGNTAGLPGVKVDIDNYINFFKSPYGGNWNDSEIIVKLDPLKSSLLLDLILLKMEDLDYLIIVFSGHGGQERQTLLELNSKGETIGESDLKSIAKRQLNIFDCCRSYLEPVVENKLLMFSKGGAIASTRQRFENRISQAIPQQITLYSCSIGQVSHDTSKGGLYSTNLLASAKNFTTEYKYVGEAHVEAANLTIAQTKNYPREEQQNPDAILPRCLTSQQLIIGIRP